MASDELPRYAVWNNKGGVGKTFVTFVMASEYARAHSDNTVVVIDMCPQANVSEILLGGNGSGAKHLSNLLAKSPRQTIGGYFDQRIASPHGKTGTETSFLTSAHTHNANLPKNLFLVAGDPSLELQAQAITRLQLKHSRRQHGQTCIRGSLILSARYVRSTLQAYSLLTAIRASRPILSLHYLLQRVSLSPARPTGRLLVQ